MFYRDRLPFPTYIDSSSQDAVATLLAQFFPMIPTIAEVASVINRINTLDMPNGHHILSGMMLELTPQSPVAVWRNEAPIRMVLPLTEDNALKVSFQFSHPEPKFNQFRDAILADYLLASIRSYCLTTKNEEFDLDQVMDITSIIGHNHGARWYSEVEGWKDAVPEASSGSILCRLVLNKLCDCYRIEQTGEDRWKVAHP